MATQPTFSDLFGAGKREALSQPTRLTPEIFEVDGSDVQIALSAGVAMAEETAAYAQGEINSTRLRTAASVSDDALEQYGASELGETRRGALAAVVPISFTRASGGPTVVPVGTLVGTAGGVTFATVSLLSFASGQVGPLTVAALASTAGPGGNVPANTITELLSTLADPTIEVNNAEPASGGAPIQSIDDYQALLQTAYTRARRGTLPAIQEAANAVERVASARAYELLDGDAQTGRVVLQILGHGGTTNSSLAAQVRTAMDTVRCAGVPVIVQPLNPRSVAIRAYGLIVKAGYDPASVLGLAADAIVSFVTELSSSALSYQVGATLYRAQLIGLLAATEGLQVPEGSLLTPAIDTAPGSGEYLSTSRDLVFLTTAPAP
jgi:uncharacterized phage protein gp47/JayE